MFARLPMSLLMLALLPLAVQASGYRPPSHSQLSYSFTCPSGSSGHISYTRDFASEPQSRLEIWVNGRYVHADAGVAAALAVRNIEQVQASCEGDTTLILIETFQSGADEGKRLATVSLFVDRDGKVTLPDR